MAVLKSASEVKIHRRRVDEGAGSCAGSERVRKVNRSGQILVFGEDVVHKPAILRGQLFSYIAHFGAVAGLGRSGSAWYHPAESWVHLEAIYFLYHGEEEPDADC